MDKLTMAHEMALAMQSREPITNMELVAALAYQYADAMQVESDKSRAQKQAEMRELLNDPNTFAEREGMHFDDVEFEVDWDQAPDWAVAWAMDRLGSRWWLEKPREGIDIWVPVSTSWKVIHMKAPSFGYTGDWRNSLRVRHATSAEIAAGHRIDKKIESDDVKGIRNHISPNTKVIER